MTKVTGLCLDGPWDERTKTAEQDYIMCAPAMADLPQPYTNPSIGDSGPVAEVFRYRATFVACGPVPYEKSWFWIPEKASDSFVIRRLMNKYNPKDTVKKNVSFKGLCLGGPCDKTVKIGAANSLFLDVEYTERTASFTAIFRYKAKIYDDQKFWIPEEASDKYVIQYLTRAYRKSD